MIENITLVGFGLAIIAAIWLQGIVKAEWHEWGVFIVFAFMFAAWHTNTAEYFPGFDTLLQQVTVITAIAVEILVFLRIWAYENYETHHE